MKRIGHEPALPMMAPDTVLVIDVGLRVVRALEEVVVTALPTSRFTRTGFYDRQRLGQGTFLTPERVDSLSHLL